MTCVYVQGSWYVELGQEGGSLYKGGGNCLNYHRQGWNRNEGSGNKNFKGEGASWVEGWVH